MARFQIEANLDGDEQLPGGRSVVHRWSIILEPDDLKKLQDGEQVKLSVALPNITARHAFIGVKNG